MGRAPGNLSYALNSSCALSRAKLVGAPNLPRSLRGRDDMEDRTGACELDPSTVEQLEARKRLKAEDALSGARGVPSASRARPSRPSGRAALRNDARAFEIGPVPQRLAGTAVKQDSRLNERRRSCLRRRCSESA